MKHELNSCLRTQENVHSSGRGLLPFTKLTCQAVSRLTASSRGIGRALLATGSPLCSVTRLSMWWAVQRVHFRLHRFPAFVLPCTFPGPSWCSILFKTSRLQIWCFHDFPRSLHMSGYHLKLGCNRSVTFF
jgi:hypothetical protein